MSEAPLVNRVAESGLVTINLENYYPEAEIIAFDLKDYLFQGLVLREKDFRTALKELDWSVYHDKIICAYCSTDAIIPVWAYMLVQKHALGHCKEAYTGSTEDYLKHHYYQVIDQLDPSEHEGGRIIIKGCSNRPVPASAYAALTSKLQPVAKSIMYGEPCSTVPIYKKPLRRVR